jgi:putative two-component system response regulator
VIDTLLERPHVLCVDDEPDVLEGLRDILRRSFVVSTARGGSQALELLHRAEFAVIVSDMRMPGMNGAQFLAEAYALVPDTPRVLLTGHADTPAAIAAVNEGRVFRFLIKPVEPRQLIGTLLAAIEERHAVASPNEATRLRLLELAGKLRSSEHDLQRSREETLHRLAVAIEFRDHDTGRHVERIGTYTAMLATYLGVDPHVRELLRTASPLHDVGKIAIPDHILRKPGPLTDDERTIMERHTTLGHAMLAEGDDELLDMAAEIALNHHERIDGTGYPRQLRGAEIPPPGRIVAVADVFDALTSDRPYRSALTLDNALTIMRAERATQFDADVLDALLDHIDEFDAYRTESQASNPPQPAGPLTTRDLDAHR